MSETRSKPVRIGLTGGIGSGKSTVARMLAELGAEVVDADAISRASTGPNGSAMFAIQQIFGSEFVDASGALDRDRMRERVFRDPAARQQLEAIIHPLVKQEIQRQCEASITGVVVLDLPLLAESPGWRPYVDAIWVVDCEPNTQVDRVVTRNGWSREQVEAVLASQARREDRLNIADAVILNDQNTSLDDLKQQVKGLWEQNRLRFGL